MLGYAARASFTLVLVSMCTADDARAQTELSFLRDKNEAVRVVEPSIVGPGPVDGADASTTSLPSEAPPQSSVFRSGRLTWAFAEALVHGSIGRCTAQPTARHRVIADDSDLPSAVIRFRT